MKRKIGLFFGTFNPVHNGHLMMANYVVNHTDIDEVNLVVNPTAPFKKNDILLPFDERTKMIELALNHTNIWDKVKVNYIEKTLSTPTYTYNTLIELNKLADENEYVIIIGADNLINLFTWKEAESIMANYEIYVCPRNGINCEDLITKYNVSYNVKNIQVMNGVPECGISSSFIRSEIENNKNIDFYVPNVIKEYIKFNNFYKK